MQHLRLCLKDKTELCSLKPFVCCSAGFFFFFTPSFSFPLVSELVLNTFGMTQADMYVCDACVWCSSASVCVYTVCVCVWCTVPVFRLYHCWLRALLSQLQECLDALRGSRTHTEAAASTHNNWVSSSLSSPQQQYCVLASNRCFSFVWYLCEYDPSIFIPVLLLYCCGFVQSLQATCNLQWHNGAMMQVHIFVMVIIRNMLSWSRSYRVLPLFPIARGYKVERPGFRRAPQGGNKIKGSMWTGKRHGEFQPTYHSEISVASLRLTLWPVCGGGWWVYCRQPTQLSLRGNLISAFGLLLTLWPRACRMQVILLMELVMNTSWVTQLRRCHRKLMGLTRREWF